VGIKGGIDQYVIPCKLEGIVVGNKQEFRRKTTSCRRYKVEEGLFKGRKGKQSHQRTSKHGEDGDRKVCKPRRQYPEVLQNKESKYF
jgi:hypothetical protein